MSRFDEKMAELAEAIKSKNSDVTGKLSVQEMIDAVIGIPLSSGGVDVSGVTATPEDVLNTVKFVNAGGSLVDGAMPTIEPVASGNNVIIPKGYNPRARTIEVGQSQSSNVAIYRCTEYDSGEAIPAYSNITVSGITSDAEANGTMTLLDRTTSGGDRLWSNGNYRLGYDVYNGYWCFYNSSTVYMPWADSAMFKARCLYTSNEGSESNKIVWDVATADDTNHIMSQVYDTMTRPASEGQYGFYYFFLLKLKAGVEYTMGMVKDVGTLQSKFCRVYNNETNELIANCNLDKTVNGIESNYANTYTPESDTLVYIKVGNNSYQSYGGTFQLFCYPAPEVIDYANKEPWQCTWEAVTGTGSIVMASQSVAERPATGVKVWSGYAGTQDAGTKAWSFNNEVKSFMTVAGITPKVGSVYTEDTTLQIANVYSTPPESGLMVALFHFDNNQSVLVDATETCMMTFDNQCGAGSTDQIKFGHGSFAYNYMNVNDYMGGAIFDLPELDSFTVEWWHYYACYYSKFGGPLLIVQNPDGQSGDYGVTWLSGADFPKGSGFRIEKQWFHHALVRDAGSDTVYEYINGKPAAVYQFSTKLGGGRKVWVRAGGHEPGNSGDVRNYMDELAIFNYAKYHGQFEPPTEPYADIVSGLGRQKGEPREVIVEGITSIVFANDPGYALLDSSATGTNRKWVTADGQWYICFDWNDTYSWVVCNGKSALDDGYICAARLVTDDDTDQTLDDFDPIGHDGWIDNYTDKKIVVIRLREPNEGDVAITKLTLSGAGEEDADGTYVWDANPGALVLSTGDVRITCAAFFGGNGYCLHNHASISSITFGTFYLAKVDDPLHILYSCEKKDMYNVGKRWTVVHGTSPAPVTSQD